MNNRNPIPDPAAPTQTGGDWQEQPRSEGPAQREVLAHKRSGNVYTWMGGATLILLGSLFMLQNMGFFIHANWWALFFFIPAVGLFAGAWTTCRESGRLTGGGIASITGGVLLSGFGLAFLCNVDLGLVWPLFLVVGGLALLVKAASPAGPDHRGV